MYQLYIVLNPGLMGAQGSGTRIFHYGQYHTLATLEEYISVYYQSIMKNPSIINQTCKHAFLSDFMIAETRDFNKISLLILVLIKTVNKTTK